MTKDEIYNAVCDIADDAGVEPAALIAALTQQNEDLFGQSLSALPETHSGYVKSARDGRRAERERKRKAESESVLAGDIKRFRELFPEVGADEIPDSVWSDTQNGIPLPYAFALYTVAGGAEKSYADKVNARNGEGAVPPVSDGASDGEISMEEVEAMSPAAVKNNFSRILKSIGKWRI